MAVQKWRGAYKLTTYPVQVLAPLPEVMPAVLGSGFAARYPLGNQTEDAAKKIRLPAL